MDNEREQRAEKVVEILANRELSDEEKGKRLRAVVPPEALVPFAELLQTLDARERERSKEVLEFVEAMQKMVLRLIAKAEKGK